MATPKGNRKKNVLAKGPIANKEQSLEFGEVSYCISSSDPQIPSSVVRPATLPQLTSHGFRLPQNPARPVRQVQSLAVVQKPTRGPSDQCPGKLTGRST